MKDPSVILSKFPSALMGWRNLRRNQVRSGLAILVILIGVFAIAAIGFTGAAVEYQTSNNLLGVTNQVTVSPGVENPNPGLTQSQVRAIRQVVGTAEVVPRKSGTAVVSVNGVETRLDVTWLSKPNLLYDASEGEIPTRLKSGAIVGNRTAEQLGIELGDPIGYQGTQYRVLAIVDSQDKYGKEKSISLILPLAALPEQEYYTSVVVVAEDPETAQELAESIEDQFNERNDVVRAETSRIAQEQINSFLDTLNLAFLGIGVISWLLASVAILNVMLMGTIERRTEIGVLRAVGVGRGAVLRMIIAEACFIGVIGSIIGAIISLLIGLAVFQILIGEPMILLEWSTFRYLVFGIGFGIAISALSSLYPAWKAATKPPVEALGG